MYKNSGSCIRVKETLSDDVLAQVGLHQGSVLSQGGHSYLSFLISLNCSLIFFTCETLEKGSFDTFFLKFS